MKFTVTLTDNGKPREAIPKITKVTPIRRSQLHASGAELQ